MTPTCMIYNLLKLHAQWTLARRQPPRTPRRDRTDTSAPRLKRRLMSATVIMSRALYT